MAKNKDINISPSKGISIVIKNDIVQPLPIKPKKKRRYKRINVLPKTPAPIMQQSAGDTSYIKDQPGRFSLWRDNTTSTPVITLAQATTQGYIPQQQLALPAPATAAPAPAPAPPQQLALPAPPAPVTVNIGDYMRAMIPQEYSSMIRPDSRFQEPNMSFDNNLDFNDTFYQALPEDKRAEYQNAKLEDIAKTIDETAAKAVADIEGTDFYKNQLDAPTQAAIKEKSKYLTIKQKLEGMKEASIKGIATKDIKNLNEPRYPQNKAYRDFYIKGLKNHEDIINKRMQELDVIIAKKTGSKQARAEAEIVTKINELKKIEDLYNK